MKLICPAKINIFLDVVSKRNDGYHNIISLMQTIGLYDLIEIKCKGKEIEVKCSHPMVPEDETNIVHKIASRIKKEYGIDSGVQIIIDKNIPVCAGLGGGSSNGAAVIKGLNEIWNLGMTAGEMTDTGMKEGADIPFFLSGGTMIAEGIGENLTRINDFIWENILVIKPSFDISTKEIYESLNPKDFGKYDAGKILDLLKKEQYKDIPHHMYNLLEKVSENKYDEIKMIKELALREGAASSLMSGSGSSVFALFEDELAAQKCSKVFSEKKYSVYLTKTVKEGIVYV